MFHSTQGISLLLHQRKENDYPIAYLKHFFFNQAVTIYFTLNINSFIISTLKITYLLIHLLFAYSTFIFIEQILNTGFFIYQPFFKEWAFRVTDTVKTILVYL